MTTTIDAPTWAARLADLGRAVRSRLIEARGSGDDLAQPVAQQAGDTIFAIDKHVEPVIEHIIASWDVPLTLIAEGLGDDGVKTFGSNPALRLITDPIDGTRNIMYDKRSAWFLAAIAPDNGPDTTVADTVASAVVELPTSKAAWADVLTATINGPATCTRETLDGKRTQRVPITPSTATTLRHGFAQVSNFFPGTKTLASQLMERIVESTLGKVEPGAADVFDDQYITTGGQMVELMLGHDRFCCDLRPLFYRVLERRAGTKDSGGRGLECHPYDVAGLLVAQRAGVIVTDGFGRALRPPMDVESPVHWCGYANRALCEQIQPVINHFFREYGLEGP